MLKQFASILILVLILGIVGISGCTSSDNTTTPIYNNSTTTAQTPVTSTNDTPTDTSSSSVSNSSSSTKDPSSTGSSSSPAASYGTYVANANTGVFHYASCSYVDRMNEGNKVYYNTREAAINAGYRPCKVCSP